MPSGAVYKHLNDYINEVLIHVLYVIRYQKAPLQFRYKAELDTPDFSTRCWQGLRTSQQVMVRGLHQASDIFCLLSP